MTGGVAGTSAPALAVVPGPRIGDRIAITDRKGSFGVNPPTILFGSLGMFFDGVAQDLQLIQSGIGVVLYCDKNYDWQIGA